VIFFQGLEDEVVPKEQAEKMFAALREKGSLFPTYPSRASNTASDGQKTSSGPWKASYISTRVSSASSSLTRSNRYY
jgi:hypothetical protein